ncbi:MAG: ISAzo13 family transposase, partial [Actinobacteria bacterium]|nr:ISAzo13 family transposase [Actinomycetota bacterium]MBU2602491.1 ISAzo13 family transposase [Actinomycetota bacterium]
MIDEHAIGERYRALAGELDERRRRLWAAAEARVCGRGGIAAVARATG